MEIATTNYASYTPADGRGFATTVGKPRPPHKLSGMPAMNTFAPYGIFNIRPALSQPAFVEKYMARLDSKEDEVLEWLNNEWAEHQERIVLLCWCRVKTSDHLSPHGFCHRLIAGHWIHEKTGIEVPELTLAGGNIAVTEPLF